MPRRHCSNLRPISRPLSGSCSRQKPLPERRTATSDVAGASCGRVRPPGGPPGAGCRPGRDWRTRRDSDDPLRLATGLAEVPDLLGRSIPALVRALSGRLKRLVLLHEESQELCGRGELYAGGRAHASARAALAVAAEAGTAQCAPWLFNLLDFTHSCVAATVRPTRPAFL